MSKVLGICNLHDCPRLGRLTSKRSIGSVTFLGRYGLIDFILSNFSNSDIDQVTMFQMVMLGLITLRLDSKRFFITRNNSPVLNSTLISITFFITD